MLTRTVKSLTTYSADHQLSIAPNMKTIVHRFLFIIGVNTGDLVDWETKNNHQNLVDRWLEGGLVQ